MRSQYKVLAAAAVAALAGAIPVAASAQGVQRTYATNPDPSSFRSRELVESGHQFFGSASRGLALAVQEATRRWGEPNGYILGEEASGAIAAGLRYGEGTLYTRIASWRVSARPRETPPKRRWLDWMSSCESKVSPGRCKAA